MKGRKPSYLFFDAENTLYIPKKGKDIKQFWNEGEQTLRRAREFFILAEETRDVLERLKARGFTLLVVSWHKEELLRQMLDSFGILDFFEDIIVNGHKGRRIKRYLGERGLGNEEALMIGDNPHVDIYPVLSEGIDAVLLTRQRVGCEMEGSINSLDALVSYLCREYNNV